MTLLDYYDESHRDQIRQMINNVPPAFRVVVQNHPPGSWWHTPAHVQGEFPGPLVVIGYAQPEPEPGAPDPHFHVLLAQANGQPGYKWCQVCDEPLMIATSPLPPGHKAHRYLDFPRWRRVQRH